jgi:3-oxoacyl-[acyl-carrier protein] reductase
MDDLSGKTAAEDVAHNIEKAGGKAAVLSGDVRKAEVAAGLIGQTVKAFGRLDILINNAGDIVKCAPIRDATDDLYDAIMALNARGNASSPTSTWPPTRHPASSPAR